MTSATPTVQEHVALPGLPFGPEPQGPNISLGDIMAMLRRRLVTIILLAFLFNALAVGGFLAWWFVYPGYRSECLIECITNIPDSQLNLEQDRLRREEHEAFVLAQARLLKSPKVLTKALTINEVQETDWFKAIEDGKHLLRLTEELAVGPVRGTYLLQVSMECREKSDATTIVDTVVSQWLETAKQSTTQFFTVETLKAARDEKQSVENSIQEKRERLRALHERLEPGILEDPVHNVVQERARVNAEQIEVLELEIAQLEDYQRIYNDPTGVAITEEDKALIEQDPNILQAQQQLLMLQLSRDAEEQKFGTNHPSTLELAARIGAAEETLASLRTEKSREVRAMRLEQVNTAVDAGRQALLLRLESQAEIEALLQDQSRLMLDYSLVEKDIEREEERLEEIEEHITALERVQRQQSAIKVNVAQSATEPLERSSPRPIMLPVSVIMATAAAMALALLLEFLDKSVRTSQDIVRHLDVAMLGTVPDTDDEEVKIDRVERVVFDAPRTMIAEAFRRIRTNLQFSAPADRQRTVLVTSPRPEDGKTTIATNLAMTVAQSGRRVLLIDANFRRPALDRLFGKSGGGLSNLLVGEGSLASYVVKSPLPMLDLLCSGPIPPNPAELLSGDGTRALLAEATEKYDQIIIDTAPALLASDAVTLATIVDGVILVVRANENSRGVARRACRLFNDVRAHLFGAVLNAARVTGGGYYREQLRSYYDYQVDATSRGNKPLPPAGD